MKEKVPCRTRSGIGAALVAGFFFTLIGCANAMNDANASMKQKDGDTKSAPARQEVAPAVFPYPDKVPPPKWPEAPKDSGYKEGMTSKEYFDHLCKTEAGEFIYKAVENVEGIYQMRPREHVTDKMLQDRYFLEDPYGHLQSEVRDIQEGYVNPRFSDYVKFKSEQGYVLYKPDQNYKFLEKPIPAHLLDQADGAKYLRYTRPNTDKLNFEDGKYFYPRNSQPPMIEERVTQLKSRYGFTWRGIERSSKDRELGIVGSELIVLDLQANEILAVRRGFLRSGKVLDSPTGIFWLGAQACPPNEVWATKAFLHKVLKPSK
jgi:hypothetical protein